MKQSTWHGSYLGVALEAGSTKNRHDSGSSEREL